MKDGKIILDHQQSIGADRSIRMYSYTDLKKDETDIVVEYKVSKRYPAKEYEKAWKMFDDLDNHRRVIELEDLLKV